METALNSVYIGTSIDGFIADKDGGLEWLDMVPNPEGDDMGYPAFMERIDALVMGRVTFETVLGFGIDWPYKKHVYVLSNTLAGVPPILADQVTIVQGALPAVLKSIHENGHYRLYLDGGKTIQSFLREDLVDEMIITTIPVLLGGGYPLFSELAKPLEWELETSKTMLGELVQRHYRRKSAA